MFGESCCELFWRVKRTMKRNNFRFGADLLLSALEDGMIKVIVTPKEIRNRKRLREEPTK